jgi:hypothetical protein
MLRSLIVSFAVLALPLGVVLAVPQFASAQIDPASKNAACEGIGAVGGSGCNNTAGTSIDSLVADVVNILSWIIGVVAVIMIIVGGFKYVTSNGDSNSIAGAKNTILYALIGLIVAALAQGLVQFVLRRVTT